MSIQIHETDNLTIIAAKGEYLESSIEESTKDKRYTLRLHISILINGKIKNIFQQYNLKKDGDIMKLEEYNSFNALCDILSNLGYDTMGFYGKLDLALEKLFTD